MFYVKAQQNKNISRFGAFLKKLISSSSGVEKESFFFSSPGFLPLTDTIVSVWSLCAWTMDVNLPPWVPPQPTICQRGTKSDVPPIMRAVLGNPAARVSALSPCPSHTSPWHDWQLCLTMKNLYMMTHFNKIPPLAAKTSRRTFRNAERCAAFMDLLALWLWQKLDPEWLEMCSKSKLPMLPLQTSNPKEKMII